MTKKPGTNGDSPDDFYTADEADTFNKAAREASEAANELGEAAAGAATNGTKAAPAVLAGATTAINSLKISGWVDNACTAYNTVRAVGFAAKTVRALQLARYAMIFLNVADQIKAGTAKSEDVEYLSKILTTEVAATAATVKLRTATNSFGYRFAAYGERGTMSDTATQFLAGGGLAGKLIGVTSLINKTTGGNPKRVCRVLGNPIVSVGSLVAGIGLMLIPGANVAFGAKAIAQAAAGVSVQIAIAFLPALLQDIVAGVLVDKNTVGEAAGEAITSGSSGIMSITANTGGNAPMTPKQAVAYANFSNDIIAQYAEEDKATLSPFDASSPNTFLGKIATRLLPYAPNNSSPSNIFASVASIATGSFSLLAPKVAYAASTDDYTMCQDYDYKDMGIATDPYCNVTYGIPPEYLDEDPIKIADRLIQSGQIDASSGDPIDGSAYATFVENCINRTRPLGDTGGDGTENDGSNCIINDSNKDYYVHYVDQRVQAGLDGEEVATQGAVATDDTNTGVEPEVGNIDIDYTDNGANVPCATGTTNTNPAIQTGYYKNANGNITLNYGGTPYKVSRVRVRTCHVGASANKPVNSQISASIRQMLKDNPKLTIVSGFRNMALQTSLWNNHPDPTWVARPGTSNHQMGIAVDLGCDDYMSINSGESCYTWLKTNASKYGFKNYPPEPWHWSVSGS